MAHEHGHEGLGEYAHALAHMREDKDRWLNMSHESPIPHEERGAFRGLAYFPVDEKYRVTARKVRDPAARRVVLATSAGVPREMVQYATLEFQLEGAKVKLWAFKAVPQRGHSHHDRMLFIPFCDATSGKESYGAARYLDVEEAEGDEQPLDFNLAYNPYCAYDAEHFVCPFPPRENHLAVAVRAGEKDYVKS
jgi:hypothetical protein